MKKIKNVGLSIAAIAVGVVFASTVTVTPANAGNDGNQSEVGDGSCAPKTDYVCGLNGVNYTDKELVR